MNVSFIDELKSTRDYLFDLYDQDDREELKVALRIVNREIRRQGSAGAIPTDPVPASNAGSPWSKADDEFLRERLAKPTQTKDEAKKILVDCSEHLKRSDAETYSRIRALQLHTNLHAWGNKPKVKWQTMHVNANDAAIPGLLGDSGGDSES